MKNGIWHPADFDGKNAGEEKTKEKTAVAIAYEPGERAPKILATGKGYLADKIIEKAKEEDVPLYQDNQLANPARLILQYLPVLVKFFSAPSM